MIRRSSSVLLASVLLACGGSPAPAPDVPTASGVTPQAGPQASSAPTAPTNSPASDPGSKASATGTADTAVANAPAPAPEQAGSKKITVKHDPAWAACHATYKPTSKDLVAESGKSAKGCETTTKMKPMLKPEKGTQADSNPPQTIKLQGKAGKCYRVYAMADSGIKDLDLVLKDSTGAVASEDSTDDPSPVLVEDGAFCFKEDDAASIVVSVGQGKGSWAFQIVSD